MKSSHDLLLSVLGYRLRTVCARCRSGRGAASWCLNAFPWPLARTVASPWLHRPQPGRRQQSCAHQAPRCSSARLEHQSPTLARIASHLSRPDAASSPRSHWTLGCEPQSFLGQLASAVAPFQVSSQWLSFQWSSSLCWALPPLADLQP